MIKKILVTGSNGFIGRAVYEGFGSRGFDVVGSQRNRSLGHAFRDVGDIDEMTDWRHALEGIDCIIHCAGITVVKTPENACVDRCFAVNSEGTRNLAIQAASAGVRRLIFLSSIKVNGEYTRYDKPFSVGDSEHPCGPYANSKQLAERYLIETAQNSDLEVVIVRIPIVYGRRVKGNFLSLLKLVRRGIPLPVRSIRNRRNFLYIENLIDCLSFMLYHPQISGQIFLVADNEYSSTPVLLKQMAELMESDLKLFSFPLFLLGIGSMVIGKTKEFESLSCSLRIDNSITKERLNWNPPFTLAEGLRDTVSWYVGIGESRNND